MSRNIVLIGFMGSGKTAVGKALADCMGYEFADTDQLIENLEGKTIPQIFNQSGEAHFRSVEKRVVRKVSGRNGVVIATGGGVVLDPGKMRDLRQKGFLVYLNASPRTLLARIAQSNNRPLLKSRNRLSEIQRLLKQRRPFYEQTDYTIQTDRMKIQEVVHDLQQWLFTQISGTVPVTLPQHSYPIEIGMGTLGGLGERLSHLSLNGQVAVVTNPRVKKLHGPALMRGLRKAGISPRVIQIPDGERFKTTRWVGRIYDALVQYKFERGSCLVGLGGGVIGDMAGFAAATYLRGISLVQAPTTLVAQVDSSIGGKTGVNHPHGKNLIGSFYQPALVCSDISVLKTLDSRNFISGLAEVIKYGVISDASFFDFLEGNIARLLQRDPGALLTAVMRSSQIKAAVVMDDEREGGVRRILNYGHTLGHALESVGRYRKHLHGEAISIGMAFAAHLSLDLGLCGPTSVRRQETLLNQAGLPVSLPKLPPGLLLQAMSHDKKVREGQVHFVLARQIGKVQIRPVRAQQIRRLLLARAKA